MTRWPPQPGHPADLSEDFGESRLDPDRWVAHYLPQWSTPERSAARYGFGPGGLELRIDADQPDWRPEDAPLRVSNLQTAQFSGPLGSERGTHRHRADGLVVRTPVPTLLAWAPVAGRVEVTVTASTAPGCMTAIWLVGTEHRDPADAGEICVAEIDAEAIGPGRTRVRLGVKAHHDPRLVTEMTEVVVPVAGDRPHTWGVEWGRDGVLIACEGEVVHESGQVLDYPLQLMIDLFELGERGPDRRYPARAVVHRVQGWSR